MTLVAERLVFVADQMNQEYFNSNNNNYGDISDIYNDSYNIYSNVYNKSNYDNTQYNNKKHYNMMQYNNNNYHNTNNDTGINHHFHPSKKSVGRSKKHNKSSSGPSQHTPSLSECLSHLSKALSLLDAPDLFPPWHFQKLAHLASSSLCKKLFTKEYSLRNSLLKNSSTYFFLFSPFSSFFNFLKSFFISYFPFFSLFSFSFPSCLVTLPTIQFVGLPPSTIPRNHYCMHLQDNNKNYNNNNNNYNNNNNNNNNHSTPHNNNLSTQHNNHPTPLNTQTLLHTIHSSTHNITFCSTSSSYSILKQTFPLATSLLNILPISLPANLQNSLPANLLNSLPANLLNSLPNRLSNSLPNGLSLSFPSNLPGNLPSNFSIGLSGNLPVSLLVSLPDRQQGRRVEEGGMQEPPHKLEQLMNLLLTHWFGRHRS